MLTTIVAITLFALFCLIHLCLYLGSLSISQWLVGSPCAHLDTKVIKKNNNNNNNNQTKVTIIIISEGYQFMAEFSNVGRQEVPSMSPFIEVKFQMQLLEAL